MSTIRQLFSSGLAAAAVASGVGAQPAPIYINNGTVQNAQVNAEAFVNNGLFQVTAFSDVPYDTQNTRFFTNKGSMMSASGFRFDYAPDSGLRRPANVFINDFGANIGSSTLTFGGIIIDDLIFGTFGAASVRINADKIVNRGQISVGTSGLIRMVGDQVSLTNGTLIVNSLRSSFDSFLPGFVPCSTFLGTTGTNFFPEAGTYDDYWGMNTITNLDTSTIIWSPSPFVGVQTPVHRITNEFGGFGSWSIFLANADASVYARAVTPTNWVIQAVFLQAFDPRIETEVRFLNTTFPEANPPQPSFLTPVLRFSAVLTNALTLNIETNSLYFVDQLASGTNFTLLPNTSYRGTFRPAPYILSRSMPCGFTNGILGDSDVPPDLLYSPAFASQVVTGRYAAYGATVESLPTRSFAPTATITNLPGRVEILANDLNLTRARIRGEGLVSVTATNLIGSLGAIIDSQNLNFNLETRTADLRVESLAKTVVDRFAGQLQAWSGAWTNTFEMENPGVDTNTVQIQFHTLILDGRSLRSQQPVTTYDFRAATSLSEPSASVVLSDNLSIFNSFLVDSRNLVIDADITLGPGIVWDSASLPRLESLVIQSNATLRVAGQASFGTDRADPYDEIINHGTLSAFSHLLRADLLDNAGEIFTGSSFLTFVIIDGQFLLTNVFVPTIGPIQVQAQTARLEGGRIATGGSVRVEGEFVKMADHIIQGQNGVSFWITNSIDDNGAVFENLVVVENGFHMDGPDAYVSGNLLGTRFESFATNFHTSVHSWAAEDRGATVAGYVDNAAIGYMKLDGKIGSLFVFGGPDDARNYALYVDVIELDGVLAQNPDLMLIIPENFTIYFAGIQSANSQIPITVEDFEPGGRYAGLRMRWVRDFAGDYGGVDVPLTPTSSIRVNRALRESNRIDSDDDGIANRDDEFPFEHLVPQMRLTGDGRDGFVRFSWNTLPNTVYSVEYTRSLANPNWVILENRTSNAAGDPLVFEDAIRAAEPQRYYRVRFVSQ